MDLKDFLDAKVREYNRQGFISNDPISIPHAFSRLQDIEISGFFAAILAWGQRVTILNKCRELMALMDNAPYDFIVNHTDEDLKPFVAFKHRTFNATDLLYFISYLKHHYSTHLSLENAFSEGIKQGDTNVKHGLMQFYESFFALEDAPKRTQKHIASPAKNSACKRINMFLRWMVRKDDCGVDFGLWNSIRTDQLVTPCDVHVDRVARKLGLISRKQTDWKTAVLLTESLRLFDPVDPVKYDFALFGLGVEEKF